MSDESAQRAHQWLAGKLQSAPNRAVLVDLATRALRCSEAQLLEREFSREMQADGYFQEELPL